MPTALAVLAHPDDIEFLCAGTLRRLHVEKGWRLELATMTAGDCGSIEHGPEVIATIRRGEATEAARMLGGQYTCLEELDLRVIYSSAVVEKVVSLINRVQPEIVFTHSPDDYHLDHEQTSKLVRAACFAAPIPNYLSRHDYPPVARIPHLYYCDPLEGKDIFGSPVPPGFCIDISGVIEAKTAALACHRSQRNWLQKHHGVDNYLDSMKAWSATQGARINALYAEGFRQHMGHSFPQNNLLTEMLQ